MIAPDRIQNTAFGVLPASWVGAPAAGRRAAYFLPLALGWVAFSSAPEGLQYSAPAVWAAEHGFSLIPPLYARAWIAWIVWLWLWTLPKTRLERFGLAFAWHLGAAWHIALLWQEFFGNAVLGWLVLPLWAALVASAY